MTTERLLDALKQGQILCGAKTTIKALKLGEVEEVFLANNCPTELQQQIKNLAKISDTTVTQMKEKNDELGMLLKKPFSVSVVSIQKSREKE